MTVVDLKMPFRGDRDYLHGTSMYTQTVGTLECAFEEELHGPFKMAIHKMARHALQLHYGTDSDSPVHSENLVAEFSFKLANCQHSAWLNETRNEVLDRVPYPEFKIAEKCIVENKRIRLREPTGFLPIEELVGMTKVLHTEIYPPMDFQWFFSRLELERLLNLDFAGELEITLERTLGNRITRSIVTAVGNHLGYIFFSRVAQ